MQFKLALDDDEIEVLLRLIDLNIRALRTTMAGDIGHQERAIHGARLIHLQRVQTKLTVLMN
jgi:hypothetical protein